MRTCLCAARRLPLRLLLPVYLPGCLICPLTPSSASHALDHIPKPRLEWLHKFQMEAKLLEQLTQLAPRMSASSGNGTFAGAFALQAPACDSRVTRGLKISR